MKTYIAKLDRDTITLDLGFKVAVVRNGVEYAESEVTQRFPKFFEEIAVGKTVAGKEEILLTDETSKVDVVVETAPVVEEIVVEVTPVEEVVEAPAEVPVETKTFGKRRK